ATRRVAWLARVLHRARRARVTAAGEAEVFAVHLAQDRAAGVGQTRHDGRADVGNVAFEGRGAVHHGHAGQADVVLQRDPLAAQLARGCPRDLALVVPGVERVVGTLGA